jgi:hypothetical protein
MILTDKSKLDMKDNELLHYQIMEVLAVSKGYNLLDPVLSVDFRMSSSFYKAASSLLQNFEIKSKKNIGEVLSIPPPIRSTRTTEEIQAEAKKIIEKELESDLNIITPEHRRGRKPKVTA